MPTLSLVNVQELAVCVLNFSTCIQFVVSETEFFATCITQFPLACLEMIEP